MAYQDIESEILELKEKHNALILAHYYEDGEIQDIADAVGDSYFLARKGQEADNPVVLMAGVVFMAESVKILSPDKIVLAPDLNAGCSLVQSSPYEKYLQWRKENPEALAMTYVNSSAAVKSISDVICTSSNAEKILASIPEDREVLFGPDKHLGRWLAKKYNRKMKMWDGSCEVHIIFSSQKLMQMKAEHPDAVVIAHPECTDAVLEHADVVGSTSLLLNEVKTNPAKKFIVATETGIFHQMKKDRAEAELIQAPFEGTCACNDCPYMKLNTLEKIRDSLATLQPQIEIPADKVDLARVSMQRMMDISLGQAVQWPDSFESPTVSI